eukprot:ctg_1726.g533
MRLLQDARRSLREQQAGVRATGRTLVGAAVGVGGACQVARQRHGEAERERRRAGMPDGLSGGVWVSPETWSMFIGPAAPWGRGQRRDRWICERASGGWQGCRAARRSGSLPAQVCDDGAEENCDGVQDGAQCQTAGATAAAFCATAAAAPARICGPGEPSAGLSQHGIRAGQPDAGRDGEVMGRLRCTADQGTGGVAGARPERGDARGHMPAVGGFRARGRTEREPDTRQDERFPEHDQNHQAESGGHRYCERAVRGPARRQTASDGVRAAERGARSAPHPRPQHSHLGAARGQGALVGRITRDRWPSPTKRSARDRHRHTDGITALIARHSAAPSGARSVSHPLPRREDDGDRQGADDDVLGPWPGVQQYGEEADFGNDKSHSPHDVSSTQPHLSACVQAAVVSEVVVAFGEQKLANAAPVVVVGRLAHFRGRPLSHGYDSVHDGHRALPQIVHHDVAGAQRRLGGGAVVQQQQVAAVDARLHAAAQHHHDGRLGKSPQYRQLPRHNRDRRHDSHAHHIAHQVQQRRASVRPARSRSSTVGRRDRPLIAATTSPPNTRPRHDTICHSVAAIRLPLLRDRVRNRARGFAVHPPRARHKHCRVDAKARPQARRQRIRRCRARSSQAAVRSRQHEHGRGEPEMRASVDGFCSGHCLVA